MKIIDHRLCHDDGTPYPFEQLPNSNYGYDFTNRRVEAHEFIVLHYTNTSNGKDAINYVFKNKSTRLSCHLVIEPNGEITQIVPFDIVSHHAGPSQWGGRTGINFYSIGIEMVNLGEFIPRTARHANGIWYVRRTQIPDEQVLLERHRLEYDVKGWQTYPDVQVAAVIEVCQLLYQHYNMLDVVGHEDISMVGKIDPGPAFPMQQVRCTVLGIEPETPLNYQLIRDSDLRSLPTDDSPAFAVGRLKNGDVLRIEERKGAWVRVARLEADGLTWTSQKGWLRERYLRLQKPFPIEPPTDPEPVDPDPQPVDPQPIDPEPQPIDPQPIDPEPPKPPRPIRPPSGPTPIDR